MSTRTDLLLRALVAAIESERIAIDAHAHLCQIVVVVPWKPEADRPAGIRINCQTVSR